LSRAFFEDHAEKTGIPPKKTGIPPAKAHIPKNACYPD
jgi:hypothetical protein